MSQAYTLSRKSLIFFPPPFSERLNKAKARAAVLRSRVSCVKHHKKLYEKVFEAEAYLRLWLSVNSLNNEIADFVNTDTFGKYHVSLHD